MVLRDLARAGLKIRRCTPFRRSPETSSASSNGQGREGRLGAVPPTAARFPHLYPLMGAIFDPGPFYRP